MIVLDTSVLVAILFGEEDALALLDRLLDSQDEYAVASATYVETGIVVAARLGDDALARLDVLLDRLGARVCEIDESVARRALRAWRRFGKGRHPASLNYGDCISYALAQELDASLAFTGLDFSRTDVRVALAP